MPCSMGCLILTTSLTRSAASISPGEASRPVTTMCWKPGRLLQRGDDLLLGDPAVLDRVGELVEQQELVALGLDPALDLRPALARLVRGLLEVAADPRPAVAHLLPVDPAEGLRGLGLADLPLAGLDELEHAAAVAPRPRAQEHPERGRRLALAVAGDDDQQRLVARLAALGLGGARGRRGCAGRRCRSCGVLQRKEFARRRPARAARRGRGGRGPARRRARRRPRRPWTRDWIACSAAARSPARPSVTMIASARRDGSRRCSVRMISSVCSSPCASGVLPAGRQGSERFGGAFDAARRRELDDAPRRRGR